MPVLKKRSRTISIRLSEEEYDALREISISKGARSISEFTRSVACQLPKDGNGDKDSEKLEALLSNLNKSMSSLDSNIQRLTDALEDKNNDN